MEITADTLEQAIKQFYQDASSQQAINQFLTAAQMSQHAWTFSWQLLAKNKSPEVQFFGANCLYIKLSKHWAELPTSQVSALRSQLLHQISQFSTGPHMVLTRLCMALACLVLQALIEIWPRALADIFETFQSRELNEVEASQARVVLLEVLTVIPEEFSTCNIVKEKKSLVRNELRKFTPQVLSLLGSMLGSADSLVVQQQGLKCFTSWIQFGVPLPDLVPLASSVFHAMYNQYLFEIATDALMQLFSHKDQERYPQSMQTLLTRLVALEDLLAKAIKDGDMDTCEGLCKLFVSAGQETLPLMLNLSEGDDDQRHVATKLVSLILQCTNVPGYYPVDECCSDLAFGFWYNLQDSIMSHDCTKSPTLQHMYHPVFLSLVQVLMQKGRYPLEEEYHNWNAEEVESHRCYRQDIADTMMYCYAFLKQPLLESLCTLLGTIVEKSSSSDIPWQEVETVLFALTSVAESVDMEECTWLPQLFANLGHVPYTHQKVVCQALCLIGSYAEWLGEHENLLGSVVPLCLQGLKSADLAQAATLSLKEVVRENATHIRPYVSDILSESKRALEGGQLKPADSRRLMMCIGYVLSVLPVADIMAYLNMILPPYIQQLHNLADLQCTVPAKSSLLVTLHMFSWLFSSLRVGGDPLEDELPLPVSAEPIGPQPVMLVLQDLLPILHRLSLKWATDPAVTENLCDVLKRALKTLLDDFTPLIEPVSVLIAEMYQTCPNTPALDMAKQILIYSASDEKFKEMSHNFFSCICNRTLDLFKKDIGEHTDIVENFMSLLSQMIKKNKSLFHNQGGNQINLIELYQAGVTGMGMHETSTVKSSCQFLGELLSSTESIPGVGHIVASHGHSLLERLIRAIAGESPRSAVDPMVDVLLAMNKYHLDILCSCFNQLVKQDGFPCARATPHDKEQFARRVLKERVNKRKLKDTVQEYALLWRGLIGTEYAAQTTINPFGT